MAWLVLPHDAPVPALRVNVPALPLTDTFPETLIPAGRDGANEGEYVPLAMLAVATGKARLPALPAVTVPDWAPTVTLLGSWANAALAVTS
jgi:hypothetical protein